MIESAVSPVIESAVSPVIAERPSMQNLNMPD